MPTRTSIITPARLAAIAVGALLLAFLALPHLARASDYFRLNTPPTVAMGIDPEETPNEEGCWSEGTGLFAAEPSYASGVSEITGEGNPFKCEYHEWAAEVFLARSPKNFGLIYFNPRDPVIGSSSLACAPRTVIAKEEGYEPIQRVMTMEVDGDTCTASFLPGTQAGTTDFAATSSRAYAGHVRFVDSLAPVSGGRAKVRVEVFGLGDASHEVTVRLRSAGGTELGSARKSLRVGDQPQTVVVPLTAAAKQALKSHREIRVHASVDIAAAGGTGDRTTQLLLRRGSPR
jgi:hypothetical protein